MTASGVVPPVDGIVCQPLMVASYNVGPTTRHVFDRFAKRSSTFLHVHTTIKERFVRGDWPRCRCSRGVPVRAGVAIQRAYLGHCNEAALRICLRRRRDITCRRFIARCELSYAAIWRTTELKNIGHRWIYDVAGSRQCARKAIAY